MKVDLVCANHPAAPTSYEHFGVWLGLTLKSQQSFQLKTSTCRDGTLKNQPNKMHMGMTPQHFHTHRQIKDWDQSWQS